MAGCLSYTELPVEYDYSYYGKFNRYKSYTILSMPIQEGDSSMNNPIVESTIKTRLHLLGYDEKSDKPNLLVTYRIYLDSLGYRGYDQPDIEMWMRNQNDEEEYDKVNYNMKTGTVVIQFYDRRQEMTIWQGYATASYGGILYQNKRVLKNAVNSILDKYRFFAEDFEFQQAPQEEG